MTADDGLPPLREVIERHGLNARKSLGQNFLFDLNLTRKIARAALPFDGFSVVEIGPGPGGLTRALLAEGAPRVIAIERDSRAIEALREIAEHYPRRLNLKEGDALEADWQSMVDGPSKVVANLPYNIATPLLVGWLTGEKWPPWFSSLTLMFQKEVAERIAAKPGTGAYGRLSILCQWRCRVRKLFDVNKSAFTPQPKVTSSIVQLVPISPPQNCKTSTLERVTAAAFGQRRKMLRSSLASAVRDPAGFLETLSIDPALRAEDLSVQEFVKIADALDATPGALP